METTCADLPLFRRVRRDDPATSLAAAIVATKASRAAVAAVQAVMQDGAARTDEELWRDVRATGYLRSLDTIQHARLALSESGVLRDTGTRRATSDGMPSRVWVMGEERAA